jgi:hypothetical protein
MNSKITFVILAVLLIAVVSPVSAAVTNHQIVRQTGISNLAGQAIHNSNYVTQRTVQSGNYNLGNQFVSGSNHVTQALRQNGRFNAADQYVTRGNANQRVIQTGHGNTATQENT